MPTTLNDRDQGRNYPIFQTEQELAFIRGAARLVTTSNPVAVGVLASLTNYVIGNGFQYKATAAAGNGDGQLALIANEIIAEFLSENDWCGDLDRELFQRSRVDGEYFLGLWHVGDGHVQARAVEPDQVTEPANPAALAEWLEQSRERQGASRRWSCNESPPAGNPRLAPCGSQVDAGNWMFGVHTDSLDAQEIHGYYVQWSNRDLDWDYLPGGNPCVGNFGPIVPPGGAGAWMEHARLNVVRSVKRGLSDFFPIEGNLDLARRVMRNMGEGSAVQAAIAWIQEMTPGVTQAQVNTGTLARADATYITPTMQGAGRVHSLQQYQPGTILKVPSGQM